MEKHSLVVPDIVSFTHYPFGFLRKPEDGKHHIIDIRGRIMYHGKMNEYRWVVEGDSKLGLPVGAENDFEAYLHMEQVLHPGWDSFEVSKRDILSRLNYANTGRYNIFINNAIAKFRKMEITALNCLMDPRRGKFYKALQFHFFDSIGILGKGDSINEISFDDDVNTIIEQLSNMRNVVFIISLSRPLKRLLEASNAIPMDWDLYVSLPEIKSRMLYRTINKLQHFGIEIISVKEIGKLLSLSYRKTSRIKDSIEHPLSLLKQKGIISNYEFTKDNNLTLKFHSQKGGRIISKDPIMNNRLYQFLTKKTNVHTKAARDCVESMYWREEEKYLVIRYFNSMKSKRNWNDGMLVLLLKGDEERAGTELAELRDWINQQLIKNRKEKEQSREEEDENHIEKAISDLLNRMEESEFQSLIDWIMANNDGFAKEYIKRNLNKVQNKKELLNNPIARTYLADAFQSVFPDKYQDIKNNIKPDNQRISATIQRSLFK